MGFEPMTFCLGKIVSWLRENLLHLPISSHPMKIVSVPTVLNGNSQTILQMMAGAPPPIGAHSATATVTKLKRLRWLND